MKTSVLLLLAVLLTGCAGSYFKWDQARQVHVGMTAAEVEQVMGRPYMVQSLPDDQIQYIYAYGTGLGGMGSFTVLLKDDKVIQVPKIPASFK